MPVHFFIPPPLSLSLFSIFPSSFQRIVRAREYFTAGINQRNSGKQLIILLLTISRSLLRLPCAPPLLFSFNRKIGRGPPTIFFDFVCYFWFHWHCLRLFARMIVHLIGTFTFMFERRHVFARNPCAIGNWTRSRDRDFQDLRRIHVRQIFNTGNRCDIFNQYNAFG